MPQTIQITPEQVPQLLAQHKAELDAIMLVLGLKTQAMGSLDEMDSALSAGDVARALLYFVHVQKLEYGMQIKGFTEKKTQLESIIKQLESPLSIPSVMPPFPPMGGRRQ